MNCESDALCIVIPAYNEEETIRSVVDDWYPVVERHCGGGGRNSRLLIVNDGSRDATGDILRELARTRPLLEPIDKENGGHGAAVLFGYRRALELGADYIFQTDSDGQTLPSEFEGFWKLRKEHDMVIGWRRGREDGLSRVVVTKVLKLVIRLCFGVSVTDANTPFRLMSASSLSEVMPLVPKDFNLSNVIISVIYAKKDMRVRYLPITFRPRQGGVNSINIRKIIKIGARALSDFRKINRALDGAGR